MLRAIKPSKIEKRFKALLFGGAGVGKTTAAIQFPKPYVIDTERGCENDSYIEILEQSGGVIYQTSDFDELLDEVKSLLSSKHDYKTLIIDPLTTIYDDLLDKSAKKLATPKDPSGTSFGKHYGMANKKMKHLCNLLLRLDMNVIITTHSKTVYGDNLSTLGNTYDCYKKLNHLFDLVLEVSSEYKKRTAEVIKTRLKGFPEFEIFNFSYEELEKRQGKEILEKKSIPEILASEEQVLEMKSLVTNLCIPDSVCDKWLDKAKSENFAEMKSSEIEKCIDYLKEKAKEKLISDDEDIKM